MEDAAKHVVTKLPLEKLWNSTGDLEAAQFEQWLDRPQIEHLLRQAKVRFVIADVGRPLIWIDPSECYSAWKADVAPHLATNGQKIALAEYPDRYAYLAQRWRTPFAEPVIVLLKMH